MYRKSNVKNKLWTSSSILNTLVIQGWIMKIEWDEKRLGSLSKNWIMKLKKNWIMNDFTRNWTFWKVHFVERQELSWESQKKIEKSSISEYLTSISIQNEIFKLDEYIDSIVDIDWTQYCSHHRLQSKWHW